MRDIQNDPRVSSVSDERSMGDGVWVYLKANFVNTHLECHTIHERTVRECCEQLNNCIRKSTPEEVNAFLGF